MNRVKLLKHLLLSRSKFSNHEVIIKFVMNNYSDFLILSVSDESERYTAWKVSKYGVFSGPYFPVFGLRIQSKYRKNAPEKSAYLDTFHEVVHRCT